MPLHDVLEKSEYAITWCFSSDPLSYLIIVCFFRYNDRQEELRGSRAQWIVMKTMKFAGRRKRDSIQSIKSTYMVGDKIQRFVN